MRKMYTYNYKSQEAIKSNGYRDCMHYFKGWFNKTEVEYDVVKDIDEW